MKYISLLVLLSLASCAQIGSFQTGRTLDKGEVEIGGSVNAIGGTQLLNDLSENGISGAEYFGIGELWTRVGFNDKMDLGLKVSTGFTGKFEARAQLIGDKNSLFAAALGGGMEFPLYSPNRLVLRTHIPVYLSLHPTPDFAVYLSPRYIHQYVEQDDNTHFIGSSAGLLARLGPRFHFGFDLSATRPQNVRTKESNSFLVQAGIGMIFRLGQGNN